MELWKKTGAAVAAAILLMGVQPAWAARGLSEDEVAAAKIQANKMVPRKGVDFAFRSHVDGQVISAGRPDSEEEMEAEAYLLTPYCYVMSLQLVQGRTGRVDFGALETAAQMYQIRLRFTGKGFGREEVAGMKIKVRQGTLHELTPSLCRYAPIQRVKGDTFLGEGSWSRMGVVLDIPAEQVDRSLPIYISVQGPGKTAVNFDAMYVDGASDQYDTKAPVFAWSPLREEF